jgi:outer membrane beta-barrel protein
MLDFYKQSSLTSEVNMLKKVFLLISLFLISSIVVASEKSVYEFSWLDKDKEIYVLQNRKFRKVGKVYVGADAVKTISGAFVDAYGGNVRGGYFFSEDWGIEGVFGKSSGDKNDTAKGVEDQQSKAFYRKVDTYFGAMAMWSPFYSKINTFNKVFYYDWMFGLGVASVKIMDNRNEFASTASESLTSSNGIGAIWNTGLRVYINESWSLRIDVTGLHVKPEDSDIEDNGNTVTTSSLFSNYDLGFGLNYAF